MTLQEWAERAKKMEPYEGEVEAPFQPHKIDAFVAWWMKKRETTSSPDDFYPLDDAADGDLLYDDAYFEWEADGDVDRSHIHEILSDTRNGPPEPDEVEGFDDEL